MAVIRDNFLVRTKQVVTREINMLPYIGSEHPIEEITGWEYDIKRWGSPFDLKLPTLPKLSNPSTQGVKESIYFKSGVGSKNLDDLLVLDIINNTDSSIEKWIPIINSGFYFRYKTSFYLYGDNSHIQYIDRDENRDNRNYIELDSIPNLNTPILAASFRRDTDTQYIDYLDKFSQVYSFSGLYLDEEELDTVSAAGKINWDNVDITKKEFLVDNTIDGLIRLFFNRDYSKTIGVIPTVYRDLGACEFLGTSNGQGHQYILDNDVTVFIQTYSLKYFPVLADSTFHIYISDGSSYSEWTRSDTFWDLINNSYQRYFVDKDLGYVFFATQTISELPTQGYDIFATYNLTLRVEYEEENLTTTTLAYDANTNPITQSINQGFVCLSHEILDPASITLYIDKQRIQSTSDPVLYGPITIGSDYAILRANVKSQSGINLPNIQVFFTLLPSDVGYLNGSGGLATSITNGKGNAYCNYQPPNNADSLGFYSTISRACTNPSYSGYQEIVLTTMNNDLIGQEETLYTYIIKKDDLILGYSTVDDFLDTLEQPSWVVDSATEERWKNEMILKYDLSDFVDPTSQNVPINGRKVVLYQINNIDNYSVSALHPVTGELGAIIPVRPVRIEQIDGLGDGTDGLWRVIYPYGAIPPAGPTEDVGGYWLISSKVVTFQAYCWSNYYNNYIYSNTISARISLPSYLLGEYINDIGLKIPFGWKLVSDNDNVAAGLDGAIFITVNPFSGPYEIIDLVNNTGSTGEWADAPFRTVGFQFNLVI